jgi:hypothetical protein
LGTLGNGYSTLIAPKSSALETSARTSAFELDLCFGLMRDMSVGVTVPLVVVATAGAMFDRRMADVQTVKLAYGPELKRRNRP